MIICAVLISQECNFEIAMAQIDLLRSRSQQTQVHVYTKRNMSSEEFERGYLKILHLLYNCNSDVIHDNMEKLAIFDLVHFTEQYRNVYDDIYIDNHVIQQVWMKNVHVMEKGIVSFDIATPPVTPTQKSHILYLASEEKEPYILPFGDYVYTKVDIKTQEVIAVYTLIMQAICVVVQKPITNIDSMRVVSIAISLGTPVVMVVDKTSHSFYGSLKTVSARNLSIEHKQLHSKTHNQIDTLLQRRGKHDEYIHMMWLDKSKILSDCVPIKITHKRHVFQVHNPRAKVVMWTRNMFESLFTHPRYKHIISGFSSTYKRLYPHICTCDFARLIVAYLFGGWYIDTDFYPIKPLTSFTMRSHKGTTNNNTLAIFYEISEHQISSTRMITNAIFRCDKGDGFIRFLLDTIVTSKTIDSHLSQRLKNTKVMNTTGPVFWGRIYEKYFKTIITPIPGYLVMPLDNKQKVTSDYDKANETAASFVLTRWNEGSAWGSKHKSKLRTSNIRAGFNGIFLDKNGQNFEIVEDKEHLSEIELALISGIVTVILIFIIVLIVRRSQ